MENDKIKVLLEPSDKNPFVIVYKPSSLPSAPLFENDTNNALAQASLLFPEIKSVHGKKDIEYGLVHRIDNATSGLLLLATTQKSFDHFEEIQKNNDFEKKYRAECDTFFYPKENTAGFPLLPNFLREKNTNTFTYNVQSHLRPFGKGRKIVRPVVLNESRYATKKSGTKLYQTRIVICKTESVIKADCTITAGYRHQVRCHLAWLGYPVKGDKLYNMNNNISSEMKFEAYGLQFLHPVTKEIFTFSI